MKRKKSVIIMEHIKNRPIPVPNNKEGKPDLVKLAIELAKKNQANLSEE